MWYVYILKCKGGSLYTGATTDIKRRFHEHKNCRGGAYTRGHKPTSIVYSERCRTRSRALKREAAIKRLSRVGKLELIK